MKIIGSAFVSGLIFSVGLGIAGMTRPTKVLGFLDLAGAWDPSLMLVMVGGIGVFSIVYWLMARREASVLGAPLQVPPRGRIDWKLFAGAAIFGLGWGLGGYCPGPAIVGAAGLAPDALMFVIAMVCGQFAHTLWSNRKSVVPSSRASEKGIPHHAS